MWVWLMLPVVALLAYFLLSGATESMGATRKVMDAYARAKDVIFGLLEGECPSCKETGRFELTGARLFAKGEFIEARCRGCGSLVKWVKGSWGRWSVELLREAVKIEVSSPERPKPKPPKRPSRPTPKPKRPTQAPKPEEVADDIKGLGDDMAHTLPSVVRHFYDEYDLHLKRLVEPVHEEALKAIAEELGGEWRQIVSHRTKAYVFVKREESR